MYVDSRNEIVCTHDKRYLMDSTMIGDTRNDNLTSPGVSKFDETGKHLWTIEIGNSINNEWSGLWESIVESHEKDGYVIVGSESYMSVTRDTLLTDAVIAKISVDGDSLWMRRYSYEREGAIALDNFHDVYPTSDGGYVAAGGSNGSDRGPHPFLYSIIMKVDSEGLLDTTTSHILTVENSEDIILYPNPTDGPLYIQQQGNKFYKVHIIDPEGKIIGKTLLKANDHTMILSDATFSQSGMYVLQFYNQERLEHIKKVMVNR